MRAQKFILPLAHLSTDSAVTWFDFTTTWNAERSPKATGLLCCQHLSSCVKYCAIRIAAHAQFVTHFPKPLRRFRAVLLNTTWLKFDALYPRS
jgi:hypothetical protein